MFTPTRTVFEITYLEGEKTYWEGNDNIVIAEIALFYDVSGWESDDDLARKIITVVEQELNITIQLISWGPIA